METTTVEPKSPTMPQPRKEHDWLQKFVGDWTFEGEVMMGPDKPSQKYNGTESVRSLDGIWILAEGRGAIPEGGPAVWITMIGYDPQKGRYVGAFAGSMMTQLWVYDGELDPSERVLTLNTEGPNMMAEGRMTPFRDVTEFVTDDHRVLTSYMQGGDGQWREIMKADYWRKR